MKPEEALDLLRSAGSDDEKLTLASVEIAIAAHPEKAQQQLRKAVYAAAVPHWFDVHILAQLLDIPEEEATPLYDAVKEFSFIEDFSARSACNVHERTRLTLIRWMRRDRVNTFDQRSRAAVKVFGESVQPHQRIEWLYHMLVVEPDLGSNELARQYDDWRRQGRVQHLQMLGAMVNEHIVEGRLSGRALAMSLDVLASVQWDYRPLADIEKLLNDALKIYQDLGDMLHQHLILMEVGDLERARGHWDAALNSFDEALVIGGEKTSSRNIAVTHSKIGTVHVQAGQFEKALAAFAEARRIREEIVAAKPEDSDAQRDLSVSYDSEGDVQQRREQFDAAFQSFDASFKISQKLANLDPSNATWQRDLALSYIRLGDAELGRGNNREALTAFQAGLAISKENLKKDPSNSSLQRDIALARGRIGEVQSVGEDVERALESYQMALDIVQKLSQRDPANALWQDDVNAYLRALQRIRDAKE